MNYLQIEKPDIGHIKLLKPVDLEYLNFDERILIEKDRICADIASSKGEPCDAYLTFYNLFQPEDLESAHLIIRISRSILPEMGIHYYDVIKEKNSLVLYCEDIRKGVSIGNGIIRNLNRRD